MAPGCKCNSSYIAKIEAEKGRLPETSCSTQMPKVEKPKIEGMKHDTGKPLAGCLSDFSNALMAISAVFTFGAQEYERNSWDSIENADERYLDAEWRHLLAGDGRDEKSGLLHESHKAWNVLARLELRLRKEKLKS